MSWGCRVTRQISIATRTELLAAASERYRAASRSEKRRILDEFVAIAGYHRKHAIRALGSTAQDAVRRKARPHRYGGEVLEALIVLWETSDRICSKRLKPLIPVLLPPLERHGKLILDSALRAQLLAVSAATIDRLLSEVRVAAAGDGAGGQDRARRCAARCRFAPSPIGRTRRRDSSRPTLWLMAAPRSRAASSKPWC